MAATHSWSRSRWLEPEHFSGAKNRSRDIIFFRAGAAPENVLRQIRSRRRGSAKFPQRQRFVKPEPGPFDFSRLRIRGPSSSKGPPLPKYYKGAGHPKYFGIFSLAHGASALPYPVLALLYAYFLSFHHGGRAPGGTAKQEGHRPAPPKLRQGTPFASTEAADFGENLGYFEHFQRFPARFQQKTSLT